MNLHDEVEKIKGEGYSEANAEANKKYISDLEKSGKNWLEVSTDTVLKEDVDFLKSI